MKNVVLTEKFIDELRSITDYIDQNSQSEAPALKFFEEIQWSIMNLRDFPEIGVVPRARSIRLKNYRVLIIDNYLVFYRIEDESVVVYHIVHAKQDYKNLI